MTRLTVRLLLAIQEALESRLAGEIDVGDDPDNPSRDDYEAASDWAAEQLLKRRQGR